MAIFRTTPFSLTQGTPIVIKVLAKNEVGWGPESLESATNALVETIP